jgi:hypothetical protein
VVEQQTRSHDGPSNSAVSAEKQGTGTWRTVMAGGPPIPVVDLPPSGFAHPAITTYIFYAMPHQRAGLKEASRLRRLNSEESSLEVAFATWSPPTNRGRSQKSVPGRLHEAITCSVSGTIEINRQTKNPTLPFNSECPLKYGSPEYSINIVEDSFYVLQTLRLWWSSWSQTVSPNLLPVMDILANVIPVHFLIQLSCSHHEHPFILSHGTDCTLIKQYPSRRRPPHPCFPQAQSYLSPPPLFPLKSEILSS